MPGDAQLSSRPLLSAISPRSVVTPMLPAMAVGSALTETESAIPVAAMPPAPLARTMPISTPAIIAIGPAMMMHVTLVTLVALARSAATHALLPVRVPVHMTPIIAVPHLAMAALAARILSVSTLMQMVMTAIPALHAIASVPAVGSSGLLALSIRKCCPLVLARTLHLPLPVGALDPLIVLSGFRALLAPLAPTLDSLLRRGSCRAGKAEHQCNQGRGQCQPDPVSHLLSPS